MTFSKCITNTSYLNLLNQHICPGFTFNPAFTLQGCQHPTSIKDASVCDTVAREAKRADVLT